MKAQLQEVRAFFSNWSPFSEMDSQVLPGQILSFFEAGTPADSRRALSNASSLFRLHECYRELGIFREGQNERAERFDELLALSVEDLAASIREGRQRDHLGLIQFCFEFGRHQATPRNDVVRQFIHRALNLPVGGKTMKYSLFIGNVLYASEGKTHDEMAEDFKNLGLAGQPVCGGRLKRPAQLEIQYDVNSSAYRTGDPGQVRDALLRAIRASGGAENDVTIKLEERV